MSALKKVFGLGAAVVVASLALGASSAFAADSATCAFTGLAGNLNPPIKPISDPTGVGQTGSYDFGGTGTCVTVEGDVGDPTSNTGVFSVNIQSHGDYQNVACSTGTAIGSDPALTSVTGTPEGPLHASYTIPFVGGTGPLIISGGSTAQHSTLAGGGVVNIIPVAPGNCVTTAVAAFAVTGAFTGVAT